jgi:hypothetical protein
MIHGASGVWSRAHRSVLQKLGPAISGAVALSFAFCSAAAFAAEPADSSGKLDFTSMSIEELLKAEITPINVLGSHTHLSREVMVGYGFSYMHYAGNLMGTHEVSMADVLAMHPVHHTWMDMRMHMFEVMYAPSDRWTLMGMGQYMDMEMGHVRANGTQFTSKSTGIGDTELMALYTALGDPRGEGHRLVLNGGISLPTGSIDKTFNGAPLEYSMQTGSGTFDLLPGITYLGTSEHFSWGSQAAGTIHLGRNDRDYSLGDSYRLGAWGHYKITEWIGPSLRLEWRQWGNIDGADRRLNPLNNPAFDAKLQEGRRLDLLAGLHLYADRGPLKGLRFDVEGGRRFTRIWRVRI